MGLPMRAAPLLLLPVLADIGEGEVFSCYHGPLGKRVPERKVAVPTDRMPVKKSTDQEGHLFFSTVPAQLGTSFQHKPWPQTVSAAGECPHTGPEQPLQKLCGHTGAEGRHQEHWVSSSFTLSFKSLDHFFTFCIRPKLSDVKQKLSQAQ